MGRAILLSTLGFVAGCSVLTDFNGFVSRPESADGAVGADGGAASVDGGAAGADAASIPVVTGSSYADAVLADGPAVYFRFEEASGEGTVRDALGRLSGTVLAGSTLGGEGRIGRALTVGTGGVDVGQAFDFEGQKPFSLEVFVFVDAVDRVYRRLFNKDDRPPAGRNNYAITVRDDGAPTLGFERYVDGAQVFISGAVAVGRWTHTVGTYDGSELALYVDGVLTERRTDGRTARSKASSLLLGNNNDRDSPLRGRLDELAVYDKALSPERIRAHVAAVK